MNDLETIDGLFQNLTNLRQLNLSYNEIAIVSPTQFSGLVNLEFLNLANNHLSALASNQFEGNNVCPKCIWYTPIYYLNTVV